MKYQRSTANIQGITTYVLIFRYSRIKRSNI